MVEQQEKDSGIRPLRADARRNSEAILNAAAEVFDTLGVEAPVKVIADKAGVGVGTLYRHFPQRPDLIKAIIQKEVDACADAAMVLVANEEPVDALAKWMQRLVDLVATKRGLGPALHSGNAAYQSLPDYVFCRLTPVLSGLLDAAAASGSIRSDVDAKELLIAACVSQHRQRWRRCSGAANGGPDDRWLANAKKRIVAVFLVTLS